MCEISELKSQQCSCTARLVRNVQRPHLVLRSHECCFQQLPVKQGMNLEISCFRCSQDDVAQLGQTHTLTHNSLPSFLLSSACISYTHTHTQCWAVWVNQKQQRASLLSVNSAHELKNVSRCRQEAAGDGCPCSRSGPRPPPAC